VLDLWFEREVKPRLLGKATLIRYADDLLITFENQDDAKRVMEVLGKRMGRFGLTLHPDKTRLLPFRRPPSGQSSGKGPATFDFLGFTMYFARAKTGRWGMWCKTRSARLRRTVKSIADWCRGNRHKRSRCNTKRSADASRGTTITSASAATFVVCCWCSRK